MKLAESPPIAQPGARDSVYILPASMEPGTIFGEFTGQKILGYAATITAREVPAERCIDRLGVPMIPDDVCIHVSGMDMFGKPVPGQYLRAFGEIRERWSDRDETALMVIARKPPHLLRLGEELPSHAEWSPARYFLTAHGIRARMGRRLFTAENVIDAAGTEREIYHSLRDSQVKVARRLLNNLVGVQRHGIDRVGRWSFRVSSP